MGEKSRKQIGKNESGKVTWVIRGGCLRFSLRRFGAELPTTGMRSLFQQPTKLVYRLLLIYPNRF